MALFGVLSLVASSSGGPIAESLGAVAAFLVGCICGAMTVVMSARGGRIASTYLSKAWGSPVHIDGVKGSLRWWRWRLGKEREKVQSDQN